jgi:hypothetical protein
MKRRPVVLREQKGQKRTGEERTPQPGAPPIRELAY